MVILGRLGRALGGSRCALIAGLPLIPGTAGAATALVFFASWPDDSGPVQFVVGLGTGLLVWALLSVVCFRGFANPRTSDSASFEDLRVRFTSVCARRDALGERPPDPGGSLRVADAHIAYIRRVVTSPDQEAGTTSWLSGWGYISLWRRLHRVEEGMLQFAPPDALVDAAIRDHGRLGGSTIEGRARYLSLLEEYLDPPQAAQASNHDRRLAAEAVIATPAGRSLLREVRFLLDSYRDDRFAQLVHRRNLVFVTMVFTGITTYGVLGLAVVREVEKSQLAAGLAYYLIGAVIGLFSELYYTARTSRGFVHDYGLAFVRLGTTPLLSGIAAVGGVALAHVGGASAAATPTVASMFELSPSGIVVAALFGLTPGLLLDRLRQQTEQYKEEIANSGIASERDSSERPVVGDHAAGSGLVPTAAPTAPPRETTATDGSVMAGASSTVERQPDG